MEAGTIIPCSQTELHCVSEGAVVTAWALCSGCLSAVTAQLFTSLGSF